MAVKFPVPVISTFPDIFTSAKPFEEGFDLTKGQIDANILRKARKLLGIFMLRRIKDQVAIRLPNRKELTILVSYTLSTTRTKVFSSLLGLIGT